MDTCPTCLTPYSGVRKRCYVCKPGRPKTGETRQCQHCSAPFYAPRWRLADPDGNLAKYCSGACQHAANRKPRPAKIERVKTAPRDTRPCAACGKPVTKLLSQAKGQNWYCNNRCQAVHMPPPGTISKQANPFRGQQATRPCVVCQTPVTRYLTPKTIAQDWACSYACAGKNQAVVRMADGSWTKPRKPRTGDTIPCSVCGTEFYRQPAYIAQGRHLCSRACNKAWQARNQTENICVGCGKPFPVRPSEKFIKTCSRACKPFGSVKRPTGRVHNGKPVRQDRKGYVWLWEPNHPSKIYGGWQPEHRLVIEQEIGRYLTSEEQVDHIDQDKSNNDPANLQVLSPSDHAKKTIGDNIQAASLLRIELAAREAELADIRAKLAALEP